MPAMWGVPSVVMFCFVFCQKFRLPIALHSRGTSIYDVGKIFRFFDPLPPSPHFHATSLTELTYFVRFSRIPPLESGHHKWKLPSCSISPRAGAAGPVEHFKNALQNITNEGTRAGWALYSPLRSPAGSMMDAQSTTVRML